MPNKMKSNKKEKKKNDTANRKVTKKRSSVTDISYDQQFTRKHNILI